MNCPWDRCQIIIIALPGTDAQSGSQFKMGEKGFA